jgi:hypothetical protein
MSGRRQCHTRRAGAVLAALLCGSVVLAGHPEPARAHPLSAVNATRFRAAVTSVTPADPDLTVTCTADGQLLQVSYKGPDVVVIAGYGGEAYLRIGPSGVDENERSPSVWLNTNRAMAGAPDYATALLAPAWRHVLADRTVAWHDRRLQWVGTGPPLPALADPGHSHLLTTWELTLTVGHSTTAVLGTLTWVPAKSGVHTLFIELGLEASAFAAAVLLVWRYQLRSRRSTPAGGAPPRLRSDG